MVNQMKEKATKSMKADMMIENEIMFKKNIHQEITKTPDIKRDTQSHLLDHHHPLLPARYQGVAVAGTTKDTMKTEVGIIQKDKKENENITKMKVDRREDLMK